MNNQWYIKKFSALRAPICKYWVICKPFCYQISRDPILSTQRISRGWDMIWYEVRNDATENRHFQKMKQLLQWYKKFNHVIMSSCHHVIMSSCHHVIVSPSHHIIKSSCHQVITWACTTSHDVIQNIYYVLIFEWQFIFKSIAFCLN